MSTDGRERGDGQFDDADAAASIPLGTVVGGRWRVTGVLGAGGFGQVLLVEDVSEVQLGEAALKILHPNTTPLERQSFLSEVKKIAVLRHQNLVGYLDSGQLTFDGDGLPARDGEIRPYLITELCERSLDDHLASAERHVLGADETLQVLADMTAGLAHLHDRGLIHRDIKPGNALYADGVWKLADFGLMRDLTATGTYHRGDLLIGTPLFMAPELFSTMMATAPSDVYALGVVAHLCAAGRAVHSGVGPALMHSITTHEPAIDPEIDPTLADIIRRCLARDPDHRPTAPELAQMLAAPPSSSPHPPPQHRSTIVTDPLTAKPPTPPALPIDPQPPEPAGHPAARLGQSNPVYSDPMYSDPVHSVGPSGQVAYPVVAPPEPTSARPTWLLVVLVGALVLALGGMAAGAAVLMAADGGARTSAGASGDESGADGVVTGGGVEVGEGVAVGESVEVGDGDEVGGDDTTPSTAAGSIDPDAHLDEPPCADGASDQIRVTNRHSEPVDYRTEIFHYDTADVRIDETFDSIEALPPGRSALLSARPNEEGAVRCAVDSFVVTPTSAGLVTYIESVEISSCVLDEFFGNYFAIEYTVENPTNLVSAIEVTFAIVDAAGVRIDESFSTTSDSVAPGERVAGTSDNFYGNVDHAGDAPFECVAITVGIDPE